MSEKTRKCLKLVRKCHCKSQTTMPFTQSFVRSQKKNKGHRTRILPRVFLYRRTLKQIKQKRSSGNVLHLFLRLSMHLHQVLKKQRWTLRRIKKKWRCVGCYSQTKTPYFRKSKNAVCSCQKVVRKCCKKFRIFLRLQGTLLPIIIYQMLLI